jgi:hypothetical protein
MQWRLTLAEALKEHQPALDGSPGDRRTGDPVKLDERCGDKIRPGCMNRVASRAGRVAIPGSLARTLGIRIESDKS